MRFFPDVFPKGREPDRAYTFNVLNTMKPEYVQGIVQHAQRIRNTAENTEMQGEFIIVSQEW